VSWDGDLIGVISNEIMVRDSEQRNNCSSHIAEDQEGSVKFKEFMTLFQKVDQESDIFERYPDVNRIMDIKAVAVNEAFRGLGVCKALFYKSRYVTVLHTPSFLTPLTVGSCILMMYNDNLLTPIGINNSLISKLFTNNDYIIRWVANINYKLLVMT